MVTDCLETGNQQDPIIIWRSPVTLSLLLLILDRPDQTRHHPSPQICVMSCHHLQWPPVSSSQTALINHFVRKTWQYVTVGFVPSVSLWSMEKYKVFLKSFWQHNTFSIYFISFSLYSYSIFYISQIFCTIFLVFIFT